MGPLPPEAGPEYYVYDLNRPPLALAESRDGEHAAGEMTQHDRQPDIDGCSWRIAWITVHMPIGTAICDASVMNSGLRVSPVPCNPPV